MKWPSHPVHPCSCWFHTDPSQGLHWGEPSPMPAALVPVPTIPGRCQSPHISAQPSNPHLGHAGVPVIQTEEERDQRPPHLPPHLPLIPGHHGPQQVTEQTERQLSQLAAVLLGRRKGELWELPARACCQGDALGSDCRAGTSRFGCKAQNPFPEG